jgi:hypothetical protein
MKLLLYTGIIFLSALLNAQTYRVAVQPIGSKFWGYANEKSQLVIEAKFLKCTDFSEDGFAAVMDNEKRYFFIDKDGNELKLPVSSYELPNFLGFGFKGFTEGIANIRVNKGVGTINTRGQWVHQAAFDKITPFKGGIAVAQTGVKHTILHQNGDSYPCPDEVIDVKDFTEEMAPFKGKNDRFGFINTKGQIVVPATFLSVGYFSNGLAWAKTNALTIGFIDKSGNWVLQPQFESAKEFDPESGFALVKSNAEWKLMDKTGKTLMVSGATGYGEFYEGLCNAKKGAKVGLINTNGEWVVPAQYDKIQPMQNGYANVRNVEFWGVIDKTGKVIIPVKYESINSNDNGLIAIKRDKLWGLMDQSGRLVTNFEYAAIRDFKNGFAAVKVDNKWGMINSTGNQVVPFQFERVEDMVKIQP